jgi:para-aminobenzoate synthetase component 1
MDIIDELEPTARNVYTGSIGYIGFDGDMDLNIVIRTFVCKGGKAYFQAGGGIVWDSDNESEYEETYHKAAALIKSISIANTIAERKIDHVFNCAGNCNRRIGIFHQSVF